MIGREWKTRAQRWRRARRVRGRLRGTPERPRLSVHRSHQHITAQVIDDERARTLVHASSLEAELLSKPGDGIRKTEIARKVGEAIARRAIGAGVKAVVFDRGRFRYHGRVRALAEGARAAGLRF